MGFINEYHKGPRFSLPCLKIHQTREQEKNPKLKLWRNPGLRDTEKHIHRLQPNRILFLVPFPGYPELAFPTFTSLCLFSGKERRNLKGNRKRLKGGRFIGAERWFSS